MGDLFSYKVDPPPRSAKEAIRVFDEVSALAVTVEPDIVSFQEDDLEAACAAYERLTGAGASGGTLEVYVSKPRASAAEIDRLSVEFFDLAALCREETELSLGIQGGLRGWLPRNRGTLVFRQGGTARPSVAFWRSSGAIRPSKRAWVSVMERFAEATHAPLTPGVEPASPFQGPWPTLNPEADAAGWSTRSQWVAHLGVTPPQRDMAVEMFHKAQRALFKRQNGWTLMYGGRPDDLRMIARAARLPPGPAKAFVRMSGRVGPSNLQELAGDLSDFSVERDTYWKIPRGAESQEVYVWVSFSKQRDAYSVSLGASGRDEMDLVRETVKRANGIGLVYEGYG